MKSSGNDEVRGSFAAIQDGNQDNSKDDNRDNSEGRG